MIAIEAPCHLGLRPPRRLHEPGTWRAPQTFREAGLYQALGITRHIRLPKPRYRFGTARTSRIRNAPALRSFTLALAAVLQPVLAGGELPLVIGGDCSILLGCLLAARTLGRCGLLHVDGHSDFGHPGNYDVSSRLGNAAGMDLALATGRGEALLTTFDSARTPLVHDGDVVQIGERESRDPDYPFPDITKTEIRRIDVWDALAGGMQATAAAAADHLVRRDVTRVWLHLDLDVLEASELRAVDSPGSPGLSFEQLADLLAELVPKLPLIGIDVTVFDPELDPDGSSARRIVQALATGFRSLRTAPWTSP